MSNINKFDNLISIIKDRIALDFTNNSFILERKLNTRLNDLNYSVSEYEKYLISNENEWEYLIELLTINETYFFREIEQIENFKKEFVELSNNKKEIKIWCSACSTGEEAYSLIFSIFDQIPENCTVSLIGTDISLEALSIAEKAIYNKNSLSFRRFKKENINKFFDEIDEENLIVKKEYRNLIKFSRFNLKDESSWFFMRDFDFIFCRNVLIYFDDSDISFVVESFYNSLNKKGFLFLGHFDPYRNIYNKFNFIRSSDNLYFKKEE